jgi:hypothetical protein
VGGEALSPRLVLVIAEGVVLFCVLVALFWALAKYDSDGGARVSEATCTRLWRLDLEPGHRRWWGRG